MQHKVLFVYEEDGEYKVESLWASKVADNYKIDNVPFFIKNIALGDIVSVENDDGDLYFEDLIEASGNSVVRLVIFDEKIVSDIGSQLVKMGCTWEGSHIKNLISVNIPKEVEYDGVKTYLEDGEANKIWEYQEACLGYQT